MSPDFFGFLWDVCFQEWAPAVTLIKLTLAAVLFAVLTGQLTAQNTNGAVWTSTFADPLQLSTNRTSGSPETNRAAGIAIWDESHVILYSLLSTGNLASRKTFDSSAGAWSFLVQVLSIETGKVELSSTLPAASYSSEIALTRGGVAVSDPGRLTFYSRTFEKLPAEFQYVPLAESTARRLPTLVRIWAGRIYSAPTGQQFVLIDSDGHHSRINVFDGNTFKNTVTRDLAEIDPSSVSVGDAGFFYTDMNSHDHVYFFNFDGAAEERKGAASTTERDSAHEPIYISPDEWLDVLHTITLVNPKGRKTLYLERKTEGVLGPAAITQNSHMAAVFKDDVRAGGMFDRDLHRTGAAVLVVFLDTPGAACEIHITPTPLTQFAMTFAGDSRLVILHDNTVSAFRIPCAE
jgi:hypothetical protein